MLIICLFWFFVCFFVLYVFFFKQKTAYEMRISDWSSDVCSSDLLDLGRGGNDGLLVLQAVAWADLDDADAGGQGHAQVSSVTRLASASTNSPSAVRTVATTPSRGAFSESSIFIASITSNSCPCATLSPPATRTSTMRPGMGAATWSPLPSAPACSAW